jgi:hypothetical protein
VLISQGENKLIFLSFYPKSKLGWKSAKFLGWISPKAGLSGKRRFEIPCPMA